jgi:hypothetical protein
MKKFILATIMIISLILGGMGIEFAQAGGINGSLGYKTQDIDKGTKVADEVLNLNVDVDFGVVDVGAEATVDYAPKDLVGVDLTIGTINELGAVTLGTTYTYEYYEDMDDKQKANVVFGFNGLPLSPMLDVELNVDNIGDGVYAVASIGEKVQLMKALDVDLNADVAYNTMNSIGEDGFYIATGTVGTNFNVINDNVFVQPFANYSYCLNDSCKTNLNNADDWTFGIAVNMAY